MLYSLDIETSGLDPWKDRLLCIGIYNPVAGYKAFTDLLSFKQWLSKIGQVKFILHNGAFDVNFLHVLNCDISSHFTYDTRTISSVLTPAPDLADGQKHIYGLENLGIQLLGTSNYKLNRTSMESYSIEEILAYNQKDCELTYQLFEELVKRLPPKYWDFVESWIMPATKFCAELGRNGVFGDWNGLAKFKVELEGIRAKALADLNEATSAAQQAWFRIQLRELEDSYNQMKIKALAKAKDPEKRAAYYDKLLANAKTKLNSFNWNSQPQLVWMLKDFYGLDLVNTRTNKETTDDERLKALSHPVCKKLLAYREVEKLLSQQVPALLDNVKPDGCVHSNFKIGGTRTGRLSSSNPNCFSLDTEVLTNNGFKSYKTISDLDLVAQYHPDSGSIEFVPYEVKYLSDNTEKTMMSVKNEHLDLILTDNHRCLFQHRKTMELIEEPACSGKWSDFRVLHSGTYAKGNGFKLTPAEIQFCVATQADGHFDKYGNLRFVFRKSRKIDRFSYLLNKLNIKHRLRITPKGLTEFKLTPPSFIFELLDYSKVFRSDVSLWEKDQIETFILELKHWDGLYTRLNTEYVSKEEINVDFAQSLCVLYGLRAHKRITRIKGTTYYRLNLTNRNYSFTTNCKVVKYKSKEQVWCIKVPSSWIVIRRGSDTLVTGNCQQISSRKPLGRRIRSFIQARPDTRLVTIDFAQIEPRLIAHYSNEPELLNAFKNEIDIYSVFASKIFKLPLTPDFKSKFPVERACGKTGGLSVCYGTGPRKFAEMVRKETGKEIPLGVAKQLVYGFRESLPRVQEFKDDLERRLANRGVIYNLLGRPVMIDNNDDLYMLSLNTLIQGSASDLVMDSQTSQIKPALIKAKIPHKFRLIVHDEIVIELPISEAESITKELIVPLMTDRMCDKLSLTVPLKVEYGISKAWEKA